MTGLDLDAIKARLQTADVGESMSPDYMTQQARWDARASLIKEDVPALLAEVERLRALLAAEPTDAEVSACAKAQSRCGACRGYGDDVKDARDGLAAACKVRSGSI